MAIATLLAGCGVEAPPRTTPPSPPPASTGVPLASPAPPLRSYCDLVAKPRAAAGREVRVVGLYRRNAEQSEMFSLACSGSSPTWIEWDNATEVPPCGPAGRDASPGDGALAGTFGLVLRGTFHRGGEGYGRANAFDFQIDARCIETLELLDPSGAPPDTLAPEIREALQRFEGAHAPGSDGTKREP